MARREGDAGFLVIELVSGQMQRMTFHADQAGVDEEIARATRHNSIQPVITEVEIIVIDAQRFPAK